MPAPGDQHRLQAGANPYLKEPQVVNAFTAQEIATLQSRLDKQLGPEYISNRPGAGGQKVHYLAAEKAINLANEVFGFNGWSSQIINTQVDFCDENTTTGKIDVGIAIIVRITLRDGTYHEDVGYGHMENCKGKAAAFEKARKEAATDALKRALRNFGNLLGNCLYDKDFLHKVTKLKAQPLQKWGAENLHRHPSYAPPKQEPPAALEQRTIPPQTNAGGANDDSHEQVHVPKNEDEFGGDLFDEMELSESYSDAAALLENSRPSGPPAQAQAAQRPQPTRHATEPQLQSRQQPPQRPRPLPQGPGQSAPGEPRPDLSNPQKPQPDHCTPPNEIQTNAPTPTPEKGHTEHGKIEFEFVSGRTHIDESTGAMSKITPFKPDLQSPSIRRTPGVNHGASGAVRRDVVSAASATPALAPAPAPAPATAAAAPRHVVNPALNPSRQIGAPMTPRKQGAFRAPGPAAGNKRPLPADGGGRSALADVSNTTANGGASRGGSPEKATPTEGGDAKRVRVGEA